MPVLTISENSVIPQFNLKNAVGQPSMIEMREAEGMERIIEDGFLMPHRKDYYLFAFVEEGKSRHWIDNVPYTVKNDTFYFTIPQQIHLKEEVCPMKGLVLNFTDEFLMLEENRMLRQLPIIQNPAATHEIELTDADRFFVKDIMLKMLEEFNTGSDWRNQMLTSLLRVLIIYLSRLYTMQYGERCITQDYCLLKKYQKLISDHHTETHEVAAYANLLNISPGYLNDVIKQQSGKTAISHIHSRLAVEAKRRLLHTQLSVKQIADELGFEDAAYFHRFFKRLVDDTPAAYRVKIREMYN